jgi:hypothetical protein
VRRFWIAFVPALAVLLPAGGAGAQPTILDAAAAGLRVAPVYVVNTAERAKEVDIDRLTALIRRGERPIFVAVLPGSAIDEAGGNVNDLPAALGRKVGLQGTYAVVAGSSFRADSSDIPSDVAKRIATSSFQARSGDGVGAVLETFVDRVNQASTSGGDGQGDAGGASGSGAGGGGLLLLLALGGGGLFLWSRSRTKRRAREEQRDFAADRQLLQAELSVLGSDVLELEPNVTMHPDARPDYDAGVTRYKSAQAAMEYADDEVDLVRVARVVDEGRYAMDRARARIEGREPPAPPEKLTRPGRHDEPALDLDERGAPVYVGYGGTPWYGGGGWFGGGGGLLTGLMLGQMLGGGFGGGWGGGWGGGYNEGGDRDDGAAGNAGGDGGDWGGGDWGGGDFGGGDIGGGGDF